VLSRHSSLEGCSPLTSIHTVLFDLDDTLYPERDYVYSGFRAVAEWAEARWGMARSITFTELRSFFDSGFRKDSFQWWLAEKNLPASCLPEMVHLLRSHSPQIQLRLESVALLNALQREGRAMGLITEGRRQVQDAKIKSLGLDHWMPVAIILGEDEPALWKPSTIPFQRALDSLHATPGEAVYIGDNPKKDFRGARALGMRTIRVRYPDGSHFLEEPATPEDGPDQEGENLTTVSALLGVSGV
jgi:putative hydrolase of the HAD superfamily